MRTSIAAQILRSCVHLRAGVHLLSPDRSRFVVPSCRLNSARSRELSELRRTSGGSGRDLGLLPKLVAFSLFCARARTTASLPPSGNSPLERVDENPRPSAPTTDKVRRPPPSPCAQAGRSWGLPKGVRAPDGPSTSPRAAPSDDRRQAFRPDARDVMCLATRRCRHQPQTSRRSPPSIQFNDRGGNILYFLCHEKKKICFLPAVKQARFANRHPTRRLLSTRTGFLHYFPRSDTKNRLKCPESVGRGPRDHLPASAGHWARDRAPRSPCPNRGPAGSAGTCTLRIAGPWRLVVDDKLQGGRSKHERSSYLDLVPQSDHESRPRTCLKAFALPYAHSPRSGSA